MVETERVKSQEKNEIRICSDVESLTSIQGTVNLVRARYGIELLAPELHWP